MESHGCVTMFARTWTGCCCQDLVMQSLVTDLGILDGSENVICLTVADIPMREREKDRRDKNKKRTKITQVKPIY